MIIGSSIRITMLKLIDLFGMAYISHPKDSMGTWNDQRDSFYRNHDEQGQLGFS